MICPVCKLGTGYYTRPNVDPGGPPQVFAYPLYQRSYKGTEGYTSPRCSECYDKAERKYEMGKRDRERKARIEAGEEEPIAPRKKPEEEAKEEEEQASDELIEALLKVNRLHKLR